MTLEKANVRFAHQARKDKGNGSAISQVLAETQQEPDQVAVEPLISTLKLGRIAEFKPGTVF